MTDSSPRRGFTLIELMIVIAIIAVIAAIAIPGLIASQRASNERNASASLKTLTSAQIDFRSNDRDGNHILDFWTRDISGLYGLCPIGSTEPVKLIDIAVASADSAPQGSAPTATAGDELSNAVYCVQSPKAMYWFIVLEQDELGASYRSVTHGIPPLDMVDWFHHAKFAAAAYPESFAGGRSMFYVNETNTIFKRALSGTVRPAAASVPPGTALISSGALGPSLLLQWPDSTELKRDYSRLD